MKERRKMEKQYAYGLIFFLVCTFMISGGHARAEDTGGWGLNDPYNTHYDPGDVEQIKASVIDVTEVVPLPGMSPGVALMVKEGDDGDEIMVHLCPTWYKKADRIGIRKGDKISIRGHYAEINGAAVVMAAKIKNKKKSFKVRLTSDGTPFWTLSQDRLKKELLEE